VEVVVVGDAVSDTLLTARPMAGIAATPKIREEDDPETAHERAARTLAPLASDEE
jgi:hypothetical protein